MSDIINFLERMGRDSRLRYLNPDALAQVMTQTRIGPELQAALLSEDQRRLEELLGAQTNVCCIVHKPQHEDDDAREDESRPEEESDDDDDRTDDDPGPTAQLGARAAHGALVVR